MPKETPNGGERHSLPERLDFRFLLNMPAEELTTFSLISFRVSSSFFKRAGIELINGLWLTIDHEPNFFSSTEAARLFAKTWTLC
jgi:hypothetical protein